jgi:hypothetical protein
MRCVRKDRTSVCDVEDMDNVATPKKPVAPVVTFTGLRHRAGSTLNQ